MEIYNNEFYHYGIPGMKWGKRKIQVIRKANNEYKTKINKIANSKSAHESDVEAARLVTTRIDKRVGGALVSATVSTLLSDVMSGKIGHYKYMNSKEIIKKFGDIGKKAAIKIATDEITARSVANKYDTSGKRIKGKNSSRFTREEVAKASINAVMMTAPIIKTLGYYKMAQMHKQKKAGETAFNKWGGRILSEKLVDYSHIIPNVNYTVK